MCRRLNRRRMIAHESGRLANTIMHAHTGETDNALLPRALKAFLRRRLMELAGLALLTPAVLLTLALATWRISDPSLDRAVDGEIHNVLGWPGAVVADLMIVQLGLAALVPVAALTAWASRLLALRPLPRPHARVLWLFPAVLLTAGFLAVWPAPAGWPLLTGLGGNLGAALLSATETILAYIMRPLAAKILAGVLLGAGALFTMLRALGIGGDAIVRAAAVLGEKRQQKVAAGIGLLGHLRLRAAALFTRRRKTAQQAAAANATPRPAPLADTPQEAATHAAPAVQPPPVRRPTPAMDTAAQSMPAQSAPVAPGQEHDAPPVAAFAPRLKRAGSGMFSRARASLSGLARLFGTSAAPAAQSVEASDIAPCAPHPPARMEPRIIPGPGQEAPAPATPAAVPPAAGAHAPQAAPSATAPMTPAAPAADMTAPAAMPAEMPAREAAMPTAEPVAPPQETAAPPQTASQEVRVGAPVDSAFLPQELDESGQPVEDAPSPQAQEPMPAAAHPPSATAAATQPASRATAPRKPATPKKPARKKIKLPPIDILAKPAPSGQQLSDAQLQENALQLAQVLEDFGVRGQIVNVCPGPVVTLYEFRPAPGIKSSRVIGLADDIARSMCAISTRIAVVPGRNVIGIELPNERRETVYLREMLQSKGYRESKFNLPLALGKNIAGEPVFADLARMPHLLIAGTTGSGKSVGINTFIMSLLYKYTPEQCRLIMIDPKMLELSIYDGIPHLLTPVVTDPRKAVVALKWAVREMEERYQKMAMLGVRNLDGYNAKVREALKKGEKITRTVQTGFDPASGEPVFEEEELDLEPLPFIVVIIDEMADLMMVAGKDIEGAVQRLAQMARAAGIHVIMATQRPSVDVITGTIKANFPTRISFQVTSKIDSRTILGEQGAEQLLGQGDMLYMAGGGRIVRLHGPFVSDEEVEQVVTFLKKQAPPEYVEAVTSEQEDTPAAAGAADGVVSASGDELYDRAVQVVLRDRKVSTSYIQRRLQIGYNKAATLIERMEAEGLISAPNSKGRREILVGGDSAQD